MTIFSFVIEKFQRKPIIFLSLIYQLFNIDSLDVNQLEIRYILNLSIKNRSYDFCTNEMFY